MATERIVQATMLGEGVMRLHVRRNVLKLSESFDSP